MSDDSDKPRITYPDRKFLDLVRSRTSFKIQGESVGYLKFFMEDFIEKVLREAESLHVEENMARIEEGRREIVCIPYSTIRKAVELVLSREV